MHLPRWFRKKDRDDMSDYDKNNLSDPTSDGNSSEVNFGGAGPGPPAPPSYRYEEFEPRTSSEHDSDTSLTQTCPTCGGSGKLTKEQEHDLVALIPVRDRRLKPRRTILYLLLAVFICVTISVLVGVFLFPRSISIKLGTTFPVNVSMTNETVPFIIINSTVALDNSNFFDAALDGFSIEVNWENFVVAQQDFKETVKVSARSRLNHTFTVKTEYANQEAEKIKRVCCGWSFNLAFLITVSAKTHSLTVSSEASDLGFKYVNCQLSIWGNC